MIIILSYVLLISAILLLFGKRMHVILWGLAVQGGLLSLLTVSIAISTGHAHMYVAALLVLMLKAIIIPGVLSRMLKTVHSEDEQAYRFSMQTTLLAALGIVGLAHYATRYAQNYIPPGQEVQVLPVTVAVLLIGLFFMIMRKKAIMQVAGFVTMENGLYLLGVVLTQGMPFIVEISVMFDVLTGVVIMGLFILNMKKHFNSVDIDRLRNLKG